MHKSSESVTPCVSRKSINHRGGGCRIFAKGWSGVVIFTALVTLESPGLPPELDMGQCGLLGYDLTPGVYDQGEQNREISPSIKSDTETHITASLQQLLNILEKIPIIHHYEVIEIVWTLKSNIYTF